MLVNALLSLAGLGPVRFNTFISGVLAIGFVFGAYYTETFRGAFLTVDRGQTEAAEAYGMRPWLVFRRIMLPQMLSFAIPGINNNWLGLMKASALVSILGLEDMVWLAEQAGRATQKPFLFYFLVSLIYMVITALSSWLFSFWRSATPCVRQRRGRRNESADLYRAVPGYLWSDGNGSTSGLAMTAELFLLALAPGMVLAVLLAIGQAYGPRLLAWPVRGFTWFFRSTPLYLQLMLIYYGLSQFDIVQLGWQNDRPFWLLFRDATFCATLALVLNTAAYVAELLAGMMATFPRQEWVAGEAYGMTKCRLFAGWSCPLRCGAGSRR